MHWPLSDQTAQLQRNPSTGDEMDSTQWQVSAPLQEILDYFSDIKGLGRVRDCASVVRLTEVEVALGGKIDFMFKLLECSGALRHAI
jgi:hypothetical protein